MVYDISLLIGAHVCAFVLIYSSFLSGAEDLPYQIFVYAVGS